MNKVIGISLLIILGILYYYNMSSNIGISRPKYKDEYEKILEINIDEEYPKTPTEVVKTFVKIKEFMYDGKEKTGEQLEQSIFRQRKLFAQELFDYNSEMEQNEAAMQEIKAMIKAKQKIVKIEVEAKNTDVDDEVIDIRTMEILPVGVKNNYIKYTLVKNKDKNRWEIYGFGSTEEFEIE